MIVVRVELHSAITGQVSEIARAEICNMGGGSLHLGDYSIRTLRGRSAVELDRRQYQRFGEVRRHQRLRLHVWHLVAKALAAAGYGKPLAESDSDMLPLEVPGT